MKHGRAGLSRLPSQKTLGANRVDPSRAQGIQALALTRGASPGGASPSPTLFEVIGAFKSISTIKVNRLLGRRGVPLWQRSYYEHIVRTGEDLRKNPQL